MIAKASKDDLAEVARILAMQSAHYARKYGELQLPDLANLLSATHIDDESAGLLRDGAEALVGVMAMVTGVGGVDIAAGLAFHQSLRQALQRAEQLLGSVPAIEQMLQAAAK